MSEKAFAITLSRPPEFTYVPGQRIGLRYQGIERDYSLTSIAEDPDIRLCIRHLHGGKLSPLLATADVGSTMACFGPRGHFTYRSSPHPTVFIATGTGIAPFVSMVRSGVKGFTLLYGAETPAQLYYEALLRPSAREYIPCLTGKTIACEEVVNRFNGRTTAYLEAHLPTGIYDFYLCGSAEMIRDATFIIDERFPDSRIFAERFY